MNPRASHVAVWLAACLTPAVCAAQTEWRFIADDLSVSAGELTGIEGGVVSYVDESGDAHDRKMSELVAAVHVQPPAERKPRELPWITRQIERFDRAGQLGQRDDTPAFPARLHLNDGQLWVGRMLSASGQSVSWFVEESVVLSAPLDRITAAEILTSMDEARASWPGVEDRVVMANGDLVDGFLDAFGEQVRFESGGSAVTVPLERVAGVLLANPPAAPAGMVLRSTGGSIVAIDGLEASVTGAFTATVEHSGDTVPLSFRDTDVRSVLFAPGAVASLASISPAETASPEVGEAGQRVVAISGGELGFGGLELRGPVRARWEFDRAASRFAATAALPPAMWAWGDCELVIRTADDREVFRERLWSERASVEINVPLAGLGGMVIEVVSGEDGSVQDRVTLSRPMIAWE